MIVLREEYLEIVDEYKDRLEPFMQELERFGVWKMLNRNVVANFAFGKTGIIYSFEVCANHWSKSDIIYKQCSLSKMAQLCNS